MNDLFAQRRDRLMRAAGDDAVIVIPSARTALRNADVEHDFRQDSDFYYLTGFDEPDSVLVLRPGREEERVVLFVRPRDPKAEIWTGWRAGTEGAEREYGADKAFVIEEFAKEMERLLEGAERLGFTLGRGDPREAALIKAARRHRTTPRLKVTGPDVIFDPTALLHETRLRKGPEEVASLRRAAAISSEGHHEAMRVAGPGRHEYELQAAVEYVFRSAGSARVGYSSIVAAGPNATVLHYNTNRSQIAEGDLVLVDAGAEVDYVTADITRTFPAGGRFSPEQRAVYEVVLQAELDAIAACTQGRPCADSHDVAVRVLTEGMVELGLLSGEVDALIEEESYKKYFMHRTGHWLGMDVHDVGLYNVGGSPRVLEAGMVTTIEPGLYVSARDEEAPEAFRGIGVRIEDDVLVTGGAPEVLTAGCVKAVDDVEAMVRHAPRWVREVRV